LVDVALVNIAEKAERSVENHPVDDVEFTVARLVILEEAEMKLVVEAVITERLVPVALVNVVEARYVCPETVRAVADAVERVVEPSTPNDPPTPNRYAGDVEPTPTLPLEAILNH
jgi:hypothetical protein